VKKNRFRDHPTVCTVLSDNLARVRTLIRVGGDSDSGDVLRGAVVLLHATLEEFVRALMVNHVALDSALLAEIALPESGARTKFGLGDLFPFRDTLVGDLAR